MSRRVAGWRAALVFGSVLIPAAAAAHGAEPIGVSVIEGPGGDVRVRVDAPVSISDGIAVELPAACVARGDADVRADRARRAVTRGYACGVSLVGAEIGVRGLPAELDGVLRVETPDGAVRRAVVTASAPRVRVAARPSWIATALSFGRLGVQHLVSGLDHLLFVAGLVLLARRARAMLGALSAFTLGHSVTLAAAALHVVKVPAALAEVGIAASLVVLGVRVVRAKVPEPPLRLAIVAGAMGLLHGLGFAYGLEATGLPEGEVPLALFGFNVGVEVGQIAVVAALLAVSWAASRVLPRVRARLLRGSRLDLQLVAGYAMGGCATMWCIERLLVLIGRA